MNNNAALLSVFNKTDIGSLAETLALAKYTIFATEGTGKALSEKNIPFLSAEKASGNPDRLQGCIKTISYNIEAGILFNRGKQQDIDDIQSMNLSPIDVVVCNFPPIAEVIKTHEDFSILNVDVGGPLMVRSAAVNYKDVLVVVDHEDYQMVANKIMNRELTDEFRKKMSIKAFKYCADYDRTIIQYLQKA